VLLIFSVKESGRFQGTVAVYAKSNWFDIIVHVNIQCENTVYVFLL